MRNWDVVRQGLANAEQLIESGRPQVALERLNLLIGRQDPGAPDHSWCCAAILRMVAVASIELGHDEFADHCYERAVQLLQVSDPTPWPDRAKTYISLAELLAARGCITEALHFADAALECVTSSESMPSPQRCVPSDELAELLRRYGLLSHQLGMIDLAQQALTLGLLVLHSACGFESDLAYTLVEVASDRAEHFGGNRHPLGRLESAIADSLAQGRS